jgi:UDP-glucuronate 4-epimerase
VDLNTLISTIENAVGRKAEIQRLPMQPGDVPITFADISRAQEILNYRPATPFAEGIEKFVAWYRAAK